MYIVALINVYEVYHTPMRSRVKRHTYQCLWSGEKRLENPFLTGVFGIDFSFFILTTRAL